MLALYDLDAAAAADEIRLVLVAALDDDPVVAALERTFARIWGAPTNGVKGAWYYLKATEVLGKEFGYLPDFKWQAAEDGPVVEMQKGPEGSCCDVPAPGTVTNRFFRIGAQATDPAAR